jgi:hypothetical protein
MARFWKCFSCGDVVAQIFLWNLWMIGLLQWSLTVAGFTYAPCDNEFKKLSDRLDAHSGNHEVNWIGTSSGRTIAPEDMPSAHLQTLLLKAVISSSFKCKGMCSGISKTENWAYVPVTGCSYPVWQTMEIWEVRGDFMGYEVFAK